MYEENTVWNVLLSRVEKTFRPEEKKSIVRNFPLNLFQILYNEKAKKKKTALMEDHFTSPMKQTYWIHQSHPAFHLFPFTDTF